MKYFIDTEFIEGTQNKRIPFTNICIGKTKPTIDLISIGIVCEDDREYYAISKDFNLKEAWNRFQIIPDTIVGNLKLRTGGIRYIAEKKKEYWIRENVLKSIWCNLFKIHGKYSKKQDAEFAWKELKDKEKYVYLKLLLLKYGKTNKQIAREIKEFCTVNETRGNGILEQVLGFKDTTDRNISFYGYYADYDWVVFCWLFGKMIDLPKGFPMFAFDLKQTLDEKVINHLERWNLPTFRFEDGIKKLKEHENYPKQTNKHNTLTNAKWNFELYNFLNKL